MHLFASLCHFLTCDFYFRLPILLVCLSPVFSPSAKFWQPTVLWKPARTYCLMSNTYFNTIIVCSTDSQASVIFQTYYAFCFYFWQGQLPAALALPDPSVNFFMAMSPILCFPIIFLSSFLKIGGIPPIGGPNAPLYKSSNPPKIFEIRVWPGRKCHFLVPLDMECPQRDRKYNILEGY